MHLNWVIVDWLGWMFVTHLIVTNKHKHKKPPCHHISTFLVFYCGHPCHHAKGLWGDDINSMLQSSWASSSSSTRLSQLAAQSGIESRTSILKNMGTRKGQQSCWSAVSGANGPPKSTHQWSKLFWSYLFCTAYLTENYMWHQRLDGRVRHSQWWFVYQWSGQWAWCWSRRQQNGCVCWRRYCSRGRQ